MNIKVKQLTTHTLKRLLQVTDVKQRASIKPRKSVINPSSPPGQFIEDSAVEHGHVESKSQNGNKDTEPRKDSDIAGGTGEELKNAETAAQTGNIDTEVQHEGSTPLSIKIDSATPDKDAENSNLRESRDFSAADSGTARISNAKDAIAEHTNETSAQIEEKLELEGPESSSASLVPRSVAHVHVIFSLPLFLAQLAKLVK